MKVAVRCSRARSARREYVAFFIRLEEHTAELQWPRCRGRIRSRLFATGGTGTGRVSGPGACQRYGRVMMLLVPSVTAAFSASARPNSVELSTIVMLA